MSKLSRYPTPYCVDNKPATPLPWADAPNRGAVVSLATAMPRDVLRGHLREGSEQDMAYARIAANAYPKLVGALKALCDTLNSGNTPEPVYFRDILRELGEAE